MRASSPAPTSSGKDSASCRLDSHRPVRSLPPSRQCRGLLPESRPALRPRELPGWEHAEEKGCAPASCAAANASTSGSSTNGHVEGPIRHGQHPDEDAVQQRNATARAATPPTAARTSALRDELADEASAAGAERQAQRRSRVCAPRRARAAGWPDSRTRSAAARRPPPAAPSANRRTHCASTTRRARPAGFGDAGPKARGGLA